MSAKRIRTILGRYWRPALYLGLGLLVYFFFFVPPLYEPFRIWNHGVPKFLPLLHAKHEYSAGMMVAGVGVQHWDYTVLRFALKQGVSADSTNPNEVVEVEDPGDSTGLVVEGRQYWVTMTDGLPSVLLSYTDRENTSPSVIFTIIDKLRGFPYLAFWIYTLSIALGVLIQVCILALELLFVWDEESVRLRQSGHWTNRISQFLEFLVNISFVILALALSLFIVDWARNYCFNGIYPKKEVGSIFLRSFWQLHGFHSPDSWFTTSTSQGNRETFWSKRPEAYLHYMEQSHYPTIFLPRWRERKMNH
jgi:hypothetical protein